MSVSVEMDSLSVWQLMRLKALADALSDTSVAEISPSAEVLFARGTLGYALVTKSFDAFHELFGALNMLWDVREVDESSGSVGCAAYPKHEASPKPVPLHNYVGSQYAPALQCALCEMDWTAPISSINAYVRLACIAAAGMPRPEVGVPPLTLRFNANPSNMVIVTDTTVELPAAAPSSLTVDTLYRVLLHVVAHASASCLDVSADVTLPWALVTLAGTVSYVRRHDQAGAVRFPLTILEQIALHVLASPPAESRTNDHTEAEAEAEAEAVRKFRAVQEIVEGPAARCQNDGEDGAQMTYSDALVDMVAQVRSHP